MAAFGFILVFSLRVGTANQSKCPWLLWSGIALLLVALASLLYFPFDTVHIFSWAWVPSIGLDLTFRWDAWGGLFVLLISLIGGLILIYSSDYLATDPFRRRFLFFFLLFSLAMAGVVVAENMLLLFVFWELTSLTSFFLIGSDFKTESARKSALQALVVTGSGGLVLLAGIIGLGQVYGGDYNLSVWLSSPETFMLSPHRDWISLCLLVGAMTKSAQFPFHFWLPNAMAAPSPVSAFLHSATMVKAGLFLLARLNPLFEASALWTWGLGVSGLLTLLLGGLAAVRFTDLKKAMAATTQASLGLMAVLLSIRTDYALWAFVLFLVAHAFYKSSLFLAVGSLDHGVGTREMSLLQGVYRKLPWTALALGLGCLSLAGIPPFFSFIAKEILFEAVLDSPGLTWILVGLLLGMLMLAALAFRILIFVLPGVSSEKVSQGHESSPFLWAPPVFLAAVGLTLGLPWFYSYALSIGVTIAPELSFSMWYFWHGFSPPLILSLILVAGALSLAYLWSRGQKASAYLLGLDKSETVYSVFLSELYSSASRTANFWQHGYLRLYVSVVVGFSALVVAFALYRYHPDPTTVQLGVRADELALSLMILVGAVLLVAFRGRMARVLTLGIIGYAVALLYLLFGAPDLALTQLLIESISVVLFVIVLLAMPRGAEGLRRRVQARNLALAGSMGALLGSCVYFALQAGSARSLVDFFAVASVPEAYGRNVVNVILVDFRGFDTMGEIVVLGIAALGVVVLLSKKKADRKVHER